MYASYESIEDRPALRFERRIGHPVEAVWSAITEQSELEQWFPTTVSGEMGERGHLTFAFDADDLPPMEGDVTKFDPPRSLGFWWGEDHLRFELRPAEGGAKTDLRFTVLLGSEGKAARDGAGWHVCLDGLEAALDRAGSEALDHASSEATDGAGSEAPDAVKGAWRKHYDEYERRGFPATAPIPEAAKS